MAGRLGKSYRVNRGESLLVQNVRPPSYRELLRIPYTDLTSGTGSGTDYAVIVFGEVGTFYQDILSTITLARIGMRWDRTGLEIPHTWHLIGRNDSPLTDQSQRLSLPFFSIAWVYDWPLNEDLRVDAQSLIGFGAVNNEFFLVDNLTALVIDLKKIGGSRDAYGFLGTKCFLRETIYGGNGLQLTDITNPTGTQIVDGGWIPYDSGSHEWLLFWSAQVALKGIDINEPTRCWLIAPDYSQPHNVQQVGPYSTRTGTPGVWDSSHVYTYGGFLPCLVSAASQQVEIRGLCNYFNTQRASRTRGGTIVGVRFEDLDGHFYSLTDPPTGVPTAIGQGPWSAAFQEYQATAPRDLDNCTVLNSIYVVRTEDANGSPISFPGYRAAAVFNKWGSTKRRDDDGLRPVCQYVHHSSARFDLLPLRDAVVLDSRTTPAREGGNFAMLDAYMSPLTQSKPVIYANGHERICVTFQLSDYGALAPPTPPTFSDVVVIPGAEGPDVSQIADWLVTPQRHYTVEWLAAWEELRTGDGYRITWGQHVKPRRRIHCVWEGISETEVLLLEQNYYAGGGKRLVRWQLPEDPPGQGKAFTFVPGTWTWTTGSSPGVFGAEADVIELVWFVTQ